MNEVLIQKSVFFQNRPFHLIAAFAEHLKPFKLLKNQIIYQAGDPANEMYFIIKGEVSFLLKIQNSEIPYYYLTEGQHFGDLSFYLEMIENLDESIDQSDINQFQYEVRQETVKANQFSELLILSKQDFFLVFKQYKSDQLDIWKMSLDQQKQMEEKKKIALIEYKNKNSKSPLIARQKKQQTITKLLEQGERRKQRAFGLVKEPSGSAKDEKGSKKGLILPHLLNSINSNLVDKAAKGLEAVVNRRRRSANTDKKETEVDDKLNLLEQSITSLKDVLSQMIQYPQPKSNQKTIKKMPKTIDQSESQTNSSEKTPKDDISHSALSQSQKNSKLSSLQKIFNIKKQKGNGQNEKIIQESILRNSQKVTDESLNNTFDCSQISIVEQQDKLQFLKNQTEANEQKENFTLNLSIINKNSTSNENLKEIQLNKPQIVYKDSSQSTENNGTFISQKNLSQRNKLKEQLIIKANENKESEESGQNEEQNQNISFAGSLEFQSYSSESFLKEEDYVNEKSPVVKAKNNKQNADRKLKKMHEI